jgi:hypothetical protein
MVKSVARSGFASVCSMIKIRKRSIITCYSLGCHHNICHLPVSAVCTSDFRGFHLNAGRETYVATHRWYSTSAEKSLSSGVVCTWQNNSTISQLYTQPVKLNEISSMPYIRIFTNRLFTCSFGKIPIYNWQSPKPVYQPFKAQLRSLLDSTCEAMSKKRSRSEETFNRDKLQQNAAGMSASPSEAQDEGSAKRMNRNMGGSGSSDCVSQADVEASAALWRGNS